MARHLVYVSAHASREILCFGMDGESGALSLLHRTPVPGHEGPSPYSLPLAVSPDGERLHAVMRMPPYPAATFRIDRATGALALLGTARLGDTVCYISVDPSGRSLVAASHSGNRILNHAIDAHGVLLSEQRQSIPGLGKAHSVIFDRAGRFAYAAALGNNTIACFAFDAERATLDPLSPAAAPPGAGPRHLALHPVLPMLYCINETGGTIDRYAVDPSKGKLTHRQTASVMPPGAPAGDNARAADIAISPDGRFLYGSERSHQTLTGFALDPNDGTMTAIGNWATETEPRGIRIEPAGRFLLCAGHKSGHLAVHAIDRDSGRLEPIARYPAGDGPNWIEILPQTKDVNR
ncbi:MAG: lactonase family protein [Lautropia sp.]